MIVKNEEAVLARCLDSVKDCVDEIIIVDTGSSDKTKEIALKYTDKVHDFEWVDDFSAARNYSFSKAVMDYQMWLDADDVIPKTSQDKLLELKESLDLNVDIVTMKYLTHFDNNGNPIHTSTRERLLKTTKNYLWQDPVHECIPLIGNVLRSDIEVHHKKEKQEVSTRNLDIYRNLVNIGKTLTPRQTYYFARELKDHGLWEEASGYFEDFLESEKGWKEDNISACHSLALCYKHMGEKQKMIPILVKSFEYDAPRGEICSEIGYYYKDLHQYSNAFRWFLVAANLEPPESSGFVLPDYWGYIPNIECCVCCYHLGDFERAKLFNERAASFKHTPAIDFNRNFFETKGL